MEPWESIRLSVWAEHLFIASMWPLNILSLKSMHIIPWRWSSEIHEKSPFNLGVGTNKVLYIFLVYVMEMISIKATLSSVYLQQSAVVLATESGSFLKDILLIVFYLFYNSVVLERSASMLRINLFSCLQFQYNSSVTNVIENEDLLFIVYRYLKKNNVYRNE